MDLGAVGETLCSEWPGRLKKLITRPIDVGADPRNTMKGAESWSESTYKRPLGVLVVVLAPEIDAEGGANPDKESG